METEVEKTGMVKAEEKKRRRETKEGVEERGKKNQKMREWWRWKG